MEITINPTETTIELKIQEVLNSKKDYITVEQYKEIKDLINNNKKDLFFIEPQALEMLEPDLNKYLEDAKMYYGFTLDEMIRFVKGLEKIGFTCSYVDLATRNNGMFTHTVYPYNLRRIN